MSKEKSFFQTLPGILTGIAALLSAVAGLYIAIRDVPERPENDMAELSVDSFSLDPMPPTQKKSVVVTALLSNSGNIDAKNILIKWWPGVNFPDPLTKTIPLIKKGEIKKVSFNYSGYKSWYSQIETKISVNANKSIIEKNFDNNTLKKKIPVWKSERGG
jgi:hypothetical protein